MGLYSVIHVLTGKLSVLQPRKIVILLEDHIIVIDAEYIFFKSYKYIFGGSLSVSCSSDRYISSIIFLNSICII